MLDTAYSKQTYDTYYIDTETNNVSFLVTCALLQKKGIKNWHFPLKLYNKKLSGLNAYDENLSDKKKAEIYYECISNRWYYLRELSRVDVTGGSTEIGGGVPFRLDRGNLALTWAITLNLNTYLIQPRQTGKTIGTCHNLLYDMHFHKNMSILHFNRNQTEANENLVRIKTAMKMLPAWMQHSTEEYIDKKKKTMRDNVKMFINSIGSRFSTMSSATNEQKADSMARGRSVNILWIDELAYIFFNKTLFQAAKPSYDTASKRAAENDMPYGMIFTTTPGDLASPHGKYAYEFMNKCIKFNEDLYDYSKNKLDKYINSMIEDRYFNFFFMEFHYYHLGYTDDWYYKIINDLGDTLRARREYGLEWINTNGLSPFQEDDIAMLIEMSAIKGRSFTEVSISKHYKMKVYEKYRGKKPVLISVDVANGLGKDSSAIVVINPETLQPIAVFKSNMVDTRRLRKIIEKIGTMLYPNCIITVENNSIGNALLSELRVSKVANKLYREVVNSVDDVGAMNFTKRKKREKLSYGHNTNPKSRTLMMEMLETFVQNYKSHICIPELVEEVKFLEYRGGRIQHSSGTHDDVVMAYFGGLYVIRYGTGLKGTGIYYNIDEEVESAEDIAFRRNLEIRVGQIHRVAKTAYRSENEDDLKARYIEDMTAINRVITSYDIAVKLDEKIKASDLRDIELANNETSVDSESIHNTANKCLFNRNNYSDDDDDDDEYSLDDILGLTFTI